MWIHYNYLSFRSIGNIVSKLEVKRVTVNLDLGDPVQLTCIFLIADWSLVPVEVITGATRGGYAGYEGRKPLIRPIEGEEGKLVMSELKVHTIPSRTAVLCYEASFIETPRHLFKQYNDVTSRVSIDQRTSMGRTKLKQLDNEVRRICMKYQKNSPGGNWHYITHLDRKNLTDKKRGLFRIVRDIQFVKVSDFVGHQ